MTKKAISRGEKSWISNKSFGHDATGAKVRSDSEALIGFIKNCKIALVEINENGMAHAELVKDQSIIVSMLQSGDKPVVTMLTLVKSKYAPLLYTLRTSSSLITLDTKRSPIVKIGWLLKRFWDGYSLLG